MAHFKGKTPQQTADVLNGDMGVTRAQAAAMLAGVTQAGLPLPLTRTATTSEDGLSSPAATKGAVHDDRAKALNMEQLRSGL